MRTAFKFIGWTLGASLVVSVLLAVLVVGMVSWPEPVTIHIDDESFTLGALHGIHWLFAICGMLMALFVVVLVVPVTVVVPLLALAFVMLLVVAIALAAVIGVAGLALSPLLLTSWLAWRLARPRRSKRPITPADASIPS